MGLLPRRQVNKSTFPTIKMIEIDETKERWWFPNPIEKVTSEQKTEIMAAVLAMLTRATFETHIYEIDGKIYQQGDGCPTGLRPSGPISRLVMDFWVDELKQIEATTIELNRINPVQF